jgi:hypothetical protein
VHGLVAFALSQGFTDAGDNSQTAIEGSLGLETNLATMGETHE